MSVTAAQLQILLTGNNAGALGAVNQTEGALDGLKSKAGSTSSALQQTFGALGLLADGILASSVKEAANFQSMTDKVRNNTLMTNADAKVMQDTIKRLASESNVPFQQLADGFMHIDNYGFSAAGSAKILEAAMKSAASTGTDTAKVADALGAVMKEFSLGTDKAAQTMDLLHTAAARGNMTLDTFVSTSGQMLGLAANLKVPLNEVAMAMATLTQHGMSAARAGTQMVGLLTHISNPSAAAVGELTRLSKITGIDLVGDFTNAGLASKGLAGVLSDVQKAVGNDTGEIEKLIPAVRGGLGAMILAGTGAKDYAANLGLAADVMSGKLTPTEDAWARRQKDFDFILGKVLNNLRLTGITIGNILLPPLMKLLNVIIPILTTVETWAASHAKLTVTILAVVGAIGTLIGGAAVLGPMFGSIASILGPLATILGTLIAPILGVAAAGVALWALWNNGFSGSGRVVQAAWGIIQPILHALQETFASIVKGFQTGGILGALRGLWDGLTQYLGPALWDLLQKAFQAFLDIPWATLGSRLLTLILGGLEALWQGLRSIPWTAIGRDLLNLLIQGFSAVVDLGKSLRDAIVAGLSQIDWAGLGQSALNIGQVILTWVVTSVQNIDWAANWKPIAIGIVGALAFALLTVISGGILLPIGAAIVAVLIPQLTNLGDNFRALGNLIQQALGQGNLDLVNRFGAAIRDGLYPILLALQTAWANVAAAFGPGSPVRQALDQLFATLKDPQTQQALAILGQGLEMIGKILGGIVLVAIGLVVGVLDGLIMAFADALPGAIRIAAGMIQVFTGAIQIFSAIVVGIFTIISDLLKGDFSKAWEAAGRMLEGVVKGWTTIFTGMSNIFVGGLQTIVGALGGFIVGFIAGFDGFFVRLLSDGEDQWSQFNDQCVKKLNQFVKDAVAALDNLPGEFVSIGGQIIEGMKKGIADKWADFRSWWNEHIASIPGAAKLGLRISSPSEVFAEIGDMIMAGLALGIERSKGLVTDSLAKQAQELGVQAGKVAPPVGDIFARGMAHTADTTLGTVWPALATSQQSRYNTFADQAGSAGAQAGARFVAGMQDAISGNGRYFDLLNSPGVLPNMGGRAFGMIGGSLDAATNDAQKTQDSLKFGATDPKAGLGKSNPAPGSETAPYDPYGGLNDSTANVADTSALVDAGNAANAAVDDTLEKILATMRQKIPKVAQELAALAATFPADIAQSVIDNGGKPTIALFTVLSDAFVHATDAARGGSQALGQVLDDSLRSLWDNASQVMSPAAIRVFAQALQDAGNTLHQGSAHLAQTLGDSIIQQAALLGAPISDALVKMEGAATKEFLAKFGADGAAAATTFTKLITSYITTHGVEPDAAMQKVLKAMVSHGEAVMKDGGAAFGQTFMAANQAWVDKFGTDMPADLIAKIEKGIRDGAPQTADALQAIIDAASTKLQRLQDLFPDFSVTQKWADQFSAAAEHIATASGGAIGAAESQFAGFLNQIADLTGTLPDGTAVRNYAAMFAAFGDATRGGSAAIMGTMEDLVVKITAATGEPLTAAVEKNIEDLVKRVGPAAAAQLLAMVGTGAATGLAAMATAAHTASASMIADAKATEAAYDAINQVTDKLTVQLAKIGPSAAASSASPFLTGLKNQSEAWANAAHNADLQVAADDTKLKTFLSDSDREYWKTKRDGDAAIAATAHQNSQDFISEYQSQAQTFITTTNAMSAAQQKFQQDSISLGLQNFTYEQNIQHLKFDQYRSQFQAVYQALIYYNNLMLAAEQALANATDQVQQAQIQRYIAGLALQVQATQADLAKLTLLQQQAASSASTAITGVGTAADAVASKVTVATDAMTKGLNGVATAATAAAEGISKVSAAAAAPQQARGGSGSSAGGGSTTTPTYSLVDGHLFSDSQLTTIASIVSGLQQQGISLVAAEASAAAQFHVETQTVADAIAATKGFTAVLGSLFSDSQVAAIKATISDLQNRGLSLAQAEASAAQQWHTSVDAIDQVITGAATLATAQQTAAQALQAQAQAAAAVTSAQNKLLDSMFGAQGQNPGFSNARQYILEAMLKSGITDPTELGRRLGAQLPGGLGPTFTGSSPATPSQVAGGSNLYLTIQTSDGVISKAAGLGLQANDRMFVQLV